MTDKLIELAERCEAATGPDRELDGAIKSALQIGQEWTRAYPEASRVWAVKYTASLDAAMTLVPDGAWWMLEGSSPNGFTACAVSPAEYVAHTPALAICAAALRARAAEQSSLNREGGNG